MHASNFGKKVLTIHNILVITEELAQPTHCAILNDEHPLGGASLQSAQ